MAQVGNLTGINAESAYNQSFGGLSDGTPYTNVMVNQDLRSESQILGKTYASGIKAFNVTSGAGASHDVYGKLMIPLYLDQQVIDISRKYTPVAEIVPRVTNKGLTADWTTISKASAFVASEDGAMNETNDTYSRESKSIRYLYAVGRVTGQAIAATPSVMMSGMNPSGWQSGYGADVSAPTAKQIEVLAKARALKELEEELIVNGDVDQTGEYDGIVQIFTDNATNNVDNNVDALTLANMNTAISYAFNDGGRPNLAVCSSEVYTDIMALIQAKIGYVPQEKNFFWGYQTLTLNSMVGEIPVVASQNLSNTSGSKAIYFLDLSVCEMRVLQDMTYEELAKTNDSEKFMIKIYECFIIKAPTFCSAVVGIA